MGLISEIKETRAIKYKNIASSFSFLFPIPAKSGVVVSEQTALTCSAVLGCTRVIAETVASLPLHIYERLEKGKIKARQHPLYPILHLQPNTEMTSFQLRETMQAHLCLWGNAYAEIEWGQDGYIKGLWPIPPQYVNIRRDKDGSIVYDVSLDTTITLSKFQVLHIRGLSPNGLKGYSPIALAREAVGLSLASEEFSARFYDNNASPGGVLEHPGQLSDKAFERLKKFWQEQHQGLSKAHRVAILEEGMKWQAIGLPLKDAQFIENRKFQVEEIARIFRVPPHLIASLDRATFSNIEHQGIEFVVHTIRPWVVRWEQELLCQLFMPYERDRYFAAFVLDGLLRGDIESRYRAYATARQWGWLSADDIREMEDMNPLPDNKGEIYLIPMNMMPANNPARSVKMTETRTDRNKRRQIVMSFYPVMADAVGKVLRREEADIMRFVLKGKSKDEIRRFLDAFYEQHSEYITKTTLPAFLSLSKMSVDTGLDMIGLEHLDVDVPTAEINSTWATEHIFYSKRYLIKKLDSTDDKEVVDTFQKVFDEWRTKRIDKIAMHILFRLHNAVCLEVWKAAGIRWKKWVADDHPSPFCKALDGKMISMDSVFFQKDTTVEMDGKRLTLWRDIFHPPIVKNCQCLIEPIKGEG